MAAVVDYGDPLVCYSILHDKKKEQLAALQTAFLDGNFSAFEPWLMALRNRLLTPTGAVASSPHARFFLAQLQAAVAAKQLEACLDLAEELAGGIRFVAGLPDPLDRAKPTISVAARALLGAYLAAFQAPVSCASPQWSHQPHQSLVLLAGMCGMQECLVDLRRFIAAPRRFHHTSDDCFDMLSELPGCVLSAIYSLVHLSWHLPELLPQVKAALEQQLLDPDQCIVEEELASRGNRHSSTIRPMTFNIAPTSAPQPSPGLRMPPMGPTAQLATTTENGTPTRRAPLLQQALDILQGKVPGCSPDMARLRALFPTALWVRTVPTDLSSALEGRGGRLLVAAGAPAFSSPLLYYCCHTIGALEVSTGRVCYQLGLQGLLGNGSCYARTFDFDSRGRMLVPMHSDSHKSVLLALDASSGRILHMSKADHSGSLRHGPGRFCAVGENCIIGNNGKLWRQSGSKVVWKRADFAAFRASSFGGRTAVLSADDAGNQILQIYGPAGELTVSRPLQLPFGPGKGAVESILMAARSICLLSQANKQLVLLDLKGAVLQNITLQTDAEFGTAHAELCDEGRQLVVYFGNTALLLGTLPPPEVFSGLPLSNSVLT
jgi:hypothetical protein